MSERVADALAPEWASFPTAATGTSYYGQGGKSLNELQAVYGGQYQNMGGASLNLPSSPAGKNRMAMDKMKNIPPEEVQRFGAIGNVLNRVREIVGL
jgi:hypothetical protein